MKTPELELLVVDYFGIRTHLIVPNVFWGFGLDYEADLVVVTRAKCAYEVELKVSRADLIADSKKRIHHNGSMFKGLWFAMPDPIYNPALVPERAGVLLVYDHEWNCPYTGKKQITENQVRIERKPQLTNVKLTDAQYIKLLELMAMRTWKLKSKLMENLK